MAKEETIENKSGGYTLHIDADGSIYIVGVADE